MCNTLLRKAIAIDFDGCLCTDAFPEIGMPNWSIIKRAKREQQAGAGLILWTCRENQLLLDAVAACEEWGLSFDAVNESLPDWIEAFKTRPRKVGASEYWDDKAVRTQRQCFAFPETLLKFCINVKERILGIYDRF
nr:hypothetical protein [uncultured Oscillibacter sp.]